MELFFCDNCDTIAIVEEIGDTIKLAPCNCVRTTLFSTPEND